MLDEIFTIITGVKFLTGFGVGLILGVILGIVIRNQRLQIKGNERNFLLIIVSIVWIISFLSDLLVVEYSTPTMIHTLMGLVVGYFYDTKFLNRKNEK